MESTKHSLDAAGMEESPTFLRARQLFVVVWVTCKQRPAAQWSGPRRCSCPCAPQACALLPGHMWLEADWRTFPSTCNQHQRRRQYLGIQHVLPRTGVLALTTGLPAEAGSPYILYIYIDRWSNFPAVQLTWHHGSTLNLVNRTTTLPERWYFRDEPS